MNRMRDYQVLVTNAETGEAAPFTLRAPCPDDALVEALGQAFLQRGWRRCLTHPNSVTEDRRDGTPS